MTFDGGADGTITTVKVQTTEQTFKYASVYLPSDPSERVSTIETLIREKWLDKDTTVEGDFNIVSDVTTETKGNAPYPNQGSDRWFGHLATLGLKDAERESAGRNAELFTRKGNTRHTRLDRFMMPEARSFHDGWQWKVTHKTTGIPFHSDHTML